MRNAKIVGRDAKTTMILGDIHFRAPEVIQGMPYGSKADSWSFGVIIYYMLTQSLPFMATDSESLEYRIINTEPDYEIVKDLHYSASCIDLLQKLLNKNVFQRLTMTAVGKCLWFKKARDVNTFNAAMEKDVNARLKNQAPTQKKKDDRDGRLSKEYLRQKSRARKAQGARDTRAEASPAAQGANQNAMNTEEN